MRCCGKAQIAAFHGTPIEFGLPCATPSLVKRTDKMAKSPIFPNWPWAFRADGGNVLGKCLRVRGSQRVLPEGGEPRMAIFFFFLPIIGHNE